MIPPAHTNFLGNMVVELAEALTKLALTQWDNLPLIVKTTSQQVYSDLIQVIIISPIVECQCLR